MLIFGMLQLGLTYQRQEAVNAAAREAARVASIPSTSNSQACGRADDALQGTNFTGTPSCSIVGNCAGTSSTVVATISVQNDIDIPFITSQTITLTGRGEFRCE